MKFEDLTSDRFLATILVSCLSGSLILADDTESAARQARLAAMRQRAEALQLKVGERPELLRTGKEPLFRYSDPVGTTTDGTLWLWTQAERPDEKIEDGAIFLFAGGTNPEVLVQVEALSGADRSWRIGFARMTAARLTVARDDQTVWEAERVRQWDPRHEYFSHFGPDRVGVDGKTGD